MPCCETFESRHIISMETSREQTFDQKSMPGQLRSRKRKSKSQSTGSRKACASQRSKAYLDRSDICCECEQGSAHRRCSASPQPVPRHDKENQQEALCCGERMDYQDYSKLFPDEDSNQILPVEQFFGNMDTVQDFPQRPSAPSTTVSRAERRRRYFALEDSEEEEEEEGEVTKRREEPDQHPEDPPLRDTEAGSTETRVPK